MERDVVSYAEPSTPPRTRVNRLMRVGAAGCVAGWIGFGLAAVARPGWGALGEFAGAAGLVGLLLIVCSPLFGFAAVVVGPRRRWAVVALLAEATSFVLVGKLLAPGH